MAVYTYDITKSGFNKTIRVYKDDILIYTGIPSSTSSEEDLVRVAKVALIDIEGSGVNSMTAKVQTVPSIANPTQISSVTSGISNPNTTSDTNEDPLNNLDADKRSQLTLEQKKKLKELSPDEVKSLNKLPLSQFKSLSTDQLIKLAKVPLSPGDKLK